MTTPTPKAADAVMPLPGVSYLGDDISYGYDREDMHAYAQAYAAQQVAELAAAEAAKERLIQTLKDCADSQYCAGVAMSRQEACLGWEHKAEKGKYGYTEHQAHAAANKAFGAHFGIYAALKLAALASSTPDQPTEQSAFEDWLHIGWEVTAALKKAHELGFLRCAGWAQRDDLFADIGSATYKKDRDHDLSTIAAWNIRTSATSDAAMLDWMLDNLVWVQPAKLDLPVTRYQCWTQDEDENYIMLSGENKSFATKREAIAAAIAAGGSQT